MALGPIEVVVVAFPGNKFNGAIAPELHRLIDNNTISVVDGLLATKDADGEVPSSSSPRSAPIRMPPDWPTCWRRITAYWPTMTSPN